MQDDLVSFLNRQTPGAEEEVVWGGARLAFHVTSYLSRELPPLASITSVRALVFRAGSVLLWREAESVHLFPGGRRVGILALASGVVRSIRSRQCPGMAMFRAA